MLNKVTGLGPFPRHQAKKQFVYCSDNIAFSFDLHIWCYSGFQTKSFHLWMAFELKKSSQMITVGLFISGK